MALPRDSNPCYSLERVANSANHPLIHRVVANGVGTLNPGSRAAMNAVDRTIINPTRGKGELLSDWRRSVRRERCADVPRQADRPVGTLRCRSTRDAVSISTRSALVWGWYDASGNCAGCSAHAGHRALAAMQSLYRTSPHTQNVDDLHERAGSRMCSTCMASWLALLRGVPAILCLSDKGAQAARRAAARIEPPRVKFVAQRFARGRVVGEALPE